MLYYLWPKIRQNKQLTSPSITKTNAVFVGVWLLLGSDLGFYAIKGRTPSESSLFCDRRKQSRIEE
jgi:hypothetical protein